MNDKRRRDLQLLVVALVAATWHRASGLGADTVDINAALYRDPNCFEGVDQMVLLDRGCYANRYDNLTRGFQLKIVVFEGEEKIDVREYINDCYDAFQFGAVRTLKVGFCERFIGGFYVKAGLRLRSSTCSGASCSPLKVGAQRFYSQAGCQGLALQNYVYPLQGECLRYSNGTQAFKLTDKDLISQVDYPGNDGCTGKFQQKYSMRDGECFPLSLPDGAGAKSFRWEVEGGAAVSPAARGAPRAWSSTMLAMAVALAIVSPCGHGVHEIS